MSSLFLRKTSNGVATLECEIHSLSGVSGSAYGTSAYGSATYGTSLPELDDEVIMTDGAVREFGGVLSDLHERGLLGQPARAITSRLYAQGYAVRAARAVVQGIYPAGTLKAKLTQMFSDTDNALQGITLHSSQTDGPVLTEHAYDYVRTQDVLDDWSLESGWPSVIDDDAKLRFIEPGTVTAPFNIVEGDGNTVGDVTAKPSRSEYYNRIIVRTGPLTSVREDSLEISRRGLWALPIWTLPETTQDGADFLAEMKLLRHLPIITRVTYDTYQDGLAPGQSQTITVPSRNINNVFLIDEVTTVVDTGGRLRRSVVAVEGLVYTTGWREQFKTMMGGFRTTTAGFVGGGTAAQRFAYFLGGFGNAEESPIPTWIPAAPRHAPVTVQLNTISRQTNSALVFVSLHALSEGVSVKARLFDVTLNTPCPGESAIVTSTTAPSIPISFTATIIDGSHWHRLEQLPSHANEGVVCVGYTE